VRRIPLLGGEMRSQRGYSKPRGTRRSYLARMLCLQLDENLLASIRSTMAWIALVKQFLRIRQKGHLDIADEFYPLCARARRPLECP